VLIRDNINRPEFSTWFRRYRPDVVIGHLTEVVPWMRACGARIPKPTVSFVSTCICRIRRAPGSTSGPADRRARRRTGHTPSSTKTSAGAPDPISFTFLPSVGSTVRRSGRLPPNGRKSK